MDYRRIIRDFAALGWLICVSLFFLGDWNPVTAHPLTLFVIGATSFFSDIPAAFVKIYHNGLPHLLFFIAFGCATVGAGEAALLPVKKLFSPRRYLVFASAAGLAVISYFTIALGLLRGYGAFGLVVAWLFLGACALAGAVRIWRHIRQEVRQATSIPWAWACFGCWVSLVAFFLVAKSLWPNVFYDAIVYHLGVPNYYLQEGGMCYIPWDAFSNFPFLVELDYTLGLFLSGLQGPQVISVFIFLLLVAEVCEFSSSFVPAVPAWVPGLFCLGVPSFLEAAIICGNDLAFALYVLLMLSCLLEWEKSDRAEWLVIAGCFAGCCACVKYTALLFVPLLAGCAIVVAVVRGPRPSVRRCVRSALLMALPALAVFSPWLVRNFIWTGNPLYPAAYTLFGGCDMTAQRYETINQLSNPPALREIFTGLWRHPLMLTMGRPEVFAKYGFQWNMGPLALLFAPLVLLLKQVPGVIKKLAAAGILFYLVWNATFIISRFLYPSITLMILVAAYGLFGAYKQSSGSIKYFICCIGACYLVLCTVIGFGQVNCRTMNRGFDGVFASDHDYMMMHLTKDVSAVVDSYPAFKFINENLGADVRVLVAADAQHLYINRRHVYSYLSATTPYDVFKARAGDNEGIRRALRDSGITHIVYNPIEMARLQDAGALAFDKQDNHCVGDFLKSGYVRLLYVDPRRWYPVQVFELL